MLLGYTRTLPNCHRFFYAEDIRYPNLLFTYQLV